MAEEREKIKYINNENDFEKNSKRPQTGAKKNNYSDRILPSLDLRREDFL